MKLTQTQERCCGAGVCILNAEGECWCGQVWDGSKMTAPSLSMPVVTEPLILDQNKQD